jgi:hypothetical protein
MSALYTALVESETKESLAAMVVELRAGLREALEELEMWRPAPAELGRGDDGRGERRMNLATLAAALHDAARLAMAADSCNALIVLRVPRGEEGRRDLVTISAYTEQGFALRVAERKIARLERRLANSVAGVGDADEGEFAPDLEEAAER